VTAAKLTSFEYEFLSQVHSTSTDPTKNTAFSYISCVHFVFSLPLSRVWRDAALLSAHTSAISCQKLHFTLYDVTIQIKGKELARFYWNLEKLPVLINSGKKQIRCNGNWICVFRKGIYRLHREVEILKLLSGPRRLQDKLMQTFIFVILGKDKLLPVRYSFICYTKSVVPYVYLLTHWHIAV
jgi:hypothetical protein